MTFDELTRRFWRSRQRDLSPNTVADYTRTFARFAAYIGETLAADVASITHDHIDDYLDNLHEAGLSSKTTANHWTALSSLWAFAEMKYNIPHCFRGKVACPKVHRDQPQPYTELEIKALLRATAYNAPWRGKPEVASRRHWALRDRAIIIVLVDTGIRASELCALKISDYDPKIGQLVVRHGKGDKMRILPLGDRALDAIDDYLDARRKAPVGKVKERPGRQPRVQEVKPDDPLFATRTGAPLERYELLNMITVAARRAEPPVANANCHRFRHTFAINYLRRYPNVYTLQAVLGHSTLYTVRLYVQIAEVDVHQAHRTASVADNWRL
jgi:site-specific recombinase XerD